MKFWLTAFLILTSASCYCQEKKDKKVIVTVSDTSNLFNRLVRSFYEKGYTLETKDESAGFINTKEKEMENYTPFQTIRAFIDGNTIIFTSKIRMGNLGTFDIEFANRRKNAFVAAWEEMESIAKQFGMLSYSK